MNNDEVHLISPVGIWKHIQLQKFYTCWSSGIMA